MHHALILSAKRKEQFEAWYLRPTWSRVQGINTAHVKSNSVIGYDLSAAGVRDTGEEGENSNSCFIKVWVPSETILKWDIVLLFTSSQDSSTTAGKSISIQSCSPVSLKPSAKILALYNLPCVTKASTVV